MTIAGESGEVAHNPCWLWMDSLDSNRTHSTEGVNKDGEKRIISNRTGRPQQNRSKQWSGERIQNNKELRSNPLPKLK